LQGLQATTPLQRMHRALLYAGFVLAMAEFDHTVKSWFAVKQ
jgi:hypothetical protein